MQRLFKKISKEKLELIISSKIWKDYVFGKKTLTQLSLKYNYSISKTKKIINLKYLFTYQNIKNMNSLEMVVLVI